MRVGMEWTWGSEVPLILMLLTTFSSAFSAKPQGIMEFGGGGKPLPQGH